MSEKDYKLESYKEANQYGRALHDALYKHAGISFTFNAILLTGLSFVVKDVGQGLYSSVFPYLVVAIAALGSVYNMGALLAFISTWHSEYRVHMLIRAYEDEADMLQVQDNVREDPIERGPVFWLTTLFFILLIAGWLSSLLVLRIDGRPVATMETCPFRVTAIACSTKLLPANGSSFRVGDAEFSTASLLLRNVT